MSKKDFDKQWISEMYKVAHLRYPKVPKDKIKNLLQSILDKREANNQDILMLDTYTNVKYSSNIYSIMDFCKVKKPLMAGNGVLIDRDKRNPSIDMLNDMGIMRNKYKKEMKKHLPGTFDFGMFNLKQLNEKIKKNAWYGINGAPTSLFFNLESATAITGKGRQLISTATLAFDMFLGANLKFLDLNDFIYYIKNIVSEKDHRVFKDVDIIDTSVSKRKVCNKMRDHFLNNNTYEKNKILIESIIYNLSKEDLNRVYYKNNIFEFCLNSKIKSLLHSMVLEEDVYIIPERDKTPKGLCKYLDTFWDYLQEYVLYDHDIIDKEYRVVNLYRKAVLVIDTDSNMLNMLPWVEFVRKNILSKEEIDSKVEKDLDHVIIYTMCFELSNMIRQVLDSYLKRCNVKKENRPLLDMKNEYLFSTMLITNVKKSYAAITEFKEGKPMFDKLDIKGLQINKSDTNRIAGKKFIDILENDILKNRNISLIDILVKVNEFEKEIRQSLRNGESTFLKPCNMKDIDAYDDVLKITGFRGYMVWNHLYPDSAITLPDHFFLVRLKLFKPKDLELIPDNEIKLKINDLIFENNEKRIKTKGCYVFAIPRDTSIPKWAIPCIDEDKIVEDILKSFMNVILALGVDKIHTDASTKRFSNFVSV